MLRKFIGIEFLGKVYQICTHTKAASRSLGSIIDFFLLIVNKISLFSFIVLHFIIFWSLPHPCQNVREEDKESACVLIYLIRTICISFADSATLQFLVIAPPAVLAYIPFYFPRAH